MPKTFQRAIFNALGFTADRIQKVEVNIGSRSQTATFKFALTPEQVKQLDAMGPHSDDAQEIAPADRQ